MESSQRYQMSDQQQPRQESKHLLAAEKKHVTVTFSLSPEVIKAINRICGGKKGDRSKFAEALFRAKLGL